MGRALRLVALLLLLAAPLEAQYATATVIDPPKHGREVVLVQFTGPNVKPVEVEYSVPREALSFRATVHAKIAELNAADTGGKAFPIGTVIAAPPPVTPPTPPDPPTKDEADRSAWLQDVRLYLAMVRLQAIIPSPEIAAQLTKVQTGYKAAYLPFVLASF